MKVSFCSTSDPYLPELHLSAETTEDQILLRIFSEPPAERSVYFTITHMSYENNRVSSVNIGWRKT